MLKSCRTRSTADITSENKSEGCCKIGIGDTVLKIIKTFLVPRPEVYVYYSTTGVPFKIECTSIPHE